MATKGLPVVVLLDGGSFLFSAAMVALIAVPAAPVVCQANPAGPSAPAGWVRVWRDWLAGLHAISGHPMLRRVLLAHGLSWLGAGITAALFVVFLRVRFDGGAVELGWWLTAQGAGGLLAAAVTGTPGPPRGRRGW